MKFQTMSQTGRSLLVSVWFLMVLAACTQRGRRNFTGSLGHPATGNRKSCNHHAGESRAECDGPGRSRYRLIRDAVLHDWHARSAPFALLS